MKEIFSKALGPVCEGERAGSTWRAAGDPVSVHTGGARLSARRDSLAIGLGCDDTNGAAQSLPTGNISHGHTPAGRWIHINFGLHPKVVPS